MPSSPERSSSPRSGEGARGWGWRRQSRLLLPALGLTLVGGAGLLAGSCRRSTSVAPPAARDAGAAATFFQALPDRHGDAVIAVATGRAGTAVAVSSGADGVARVWDLARQVSVATFTGAAFHFPAAVIAPDGRWAMAANVDGRLRRWDLHSGAILADYAGHSGGATAVALAPGAEQAVSGGQDGGVAIWALAAPGGAPVVRYKHGGAVVAVGFAAAGKDVLSVGRDEQICTASSVAVGNGTGVGGVGGSGAPRCFEALSERLTCAAVGPELVITAGAYGGVKVWSVGARKLLRSWEAHKGEVSALSYAAAAGLVLSGGQDGTVRLFAVADGREVAAHPAPPNAAYVSALVLAEDGKAALVGYSNGALFVWRINAG